LVGYPPGGPVDILARVVGDRLSTIWGQPAVVENITGASGNIAADRAAKSAPDGYTLLVSTNAQLVVNPSLYKMPFNPATDLMPISLAVYSPNILVVPNEVPAKTVKELVEYLRANPGKSFASAGVGTTQHLAGELFKAITHVDIQHVPYRGAAPVITDMLGGRITMFFGAISPLIPLVREGKLRALAVTGPKRSSVFPDLPTVAEAGLPGYEAVLHYGLVTSAGTPRPIVDKLNAALRAALADASLRDALAKQGAEPLPSTPEEYATDIDHEEMKWSKIVRESGLKGE
jgi:tripartite-type tricarboxylate transporter receptor subunit TctC